MPKKTVVLDPWDPNPVNAGMKRAGIDMRAVVIEANRAYKDAVRAIKGTHSSFNKSDVRYSTFVMVLDKHIKALR